MQNLLHGLYAITDAGISPADRLAKDVQQALLGGARIIQYRDKSLDSRLRQHQAGELQKLCAEHNALLIINDDVELAAAVGAAGVHLGSDDTDLASAREQLGNNSIIGISCYNRMELAEQAVTAGADYIAFGSFFTSSIKPEAVRAEPELLQQARQLGKPVCAIGGITHENAPDLIKAGADMLAVISDVFAQKDICQAASRLAALFDK